MQADIQSDRVFVGIHEPANGWMELPQVILRALADPGQSFGFSDDLAVAQGGHEQIEGLGFS